MQGVLSVEGELLNGPLKIVAVSDKHKKSSLGPKGSVRPFFLACWGDPDHKLGPTGWWVVARDYSGT